MLAPVDMEPQPEAANKSTARTRKIWLDIARGAWIVCALLLLANFVASIPVYYRLMQTICTLPNQVPCTMSDQITNNSGQLTQGNVIALTHLHLSVSTYAAFVVTVTVVVSLLFWGVGLLIFWRKSNEGMGLFVSLLLIYYGATGVTGALEAAYEPVQIPLFFELIFWLVTITQWAALGAFLLTFPTGRFVPRWSWLLILVWIIEFVGPGLFTSLPGWLTTLADVLMIGGTLGIMLYRYVRIFDVRQRLQTKWFVYAFAIAVALSLVSSVFLGGLSAVSPYQLLSVIINVVTAAVIPIGVGIAILRYRLWDIDVIIRRTLVYGSLTVLLAILYFGFIFFLQFLLQGIFEKNNAVIIVISTLAIAALFQPLRHRIQSIIDRRFYRRKYDASRTLAQFSASLRNEVDLDQLQKNLLAVVQETMQPAYVSLWIRPSTRYPSVPPLR